MNELPVLLEYCEDCMLWWDGMWKGHYCEAKGGACVRKPYSIKEANWRFHMMDEGLKVQVWEQHSWTKGTDHQIFSCDWSFESFCNAPPHMIAAAVNLYEDSVWDDIGHWGAEYRTFNIHDPESYKEYEENKRAAWAAQEEERRIIQHYQDQYEERMAAQDQDFVRAFNMMMLKEDAERHM
tara:strand:- start:9820 stop:10362 length:543 start_codon:yes stop_codon:yes gene_type:complete